MDAACGVGRVIATAWSRPRPAGDLVVHLTDRDEP